MMRCNNILLQLKQLAEEENSAKAAQAQREEKLSADISSFLEKLSAVTEEQVSAIFSSPSPLEALENDRK